MPQFTISQYRVGYDNSLVLSYGGKEIYLDGRPEPGDTIGQYRFSAVSIRRLRIFLNEVVGSLGKGD